MAEISKREKKWLGLAALAYFLVFFGFTSLRHANFQTQTWDMAVFTQTLWNTINGEVMQNTLEQVPNHLGVHWRPIMFLLVPGYWFWPSAYFLLFIQALGFAAGVWPVYFLAKWVLKKERLAWLMATAYLFYPSLHWVNTFDFHEISLFIPLLLWTIYFFENGRLGWAAIFAALTAAVKEDAIIIMFFVGLYFLTRKGISSSGRKFGISIAVLAIIYFILATKVFMPAVGGGLFRFDRYEHIGATPMEAAKNLVIHPTLFFQIVLEKEKLIYLFWVFLPMAFLPLFSGRALILLIPGLLENLLSRFELQTTGFYQYDAVLVPAMIISSIYGLRWLMNKWPDKEKIIFWSMNGLIAASFLLRSPVSPFNFPYEYFRTNPQWEAYKNLVGIVPPQLSVAAQTNLVPHLANRRVVYQLGFEREPVDMLLIDGADSFGFPNQEALEKYARSYLETGNYKMTVIDERYLIVLNKKYKLGGL